MGSVVSFIVVNLYMKHFGRIALSTTTTPRLWMRYMDDTLCHPPFVIQQEEHKQNFLECINNVYPAIKFILDSNQQDSAMPFLDTIVKFEADNTLSLTVYRKLCILTNTFSGTATTI